MRYAETLERQVAQVRLWQSPYGLERAMSPGLQNFFRYRAGPSKLRDFFVDHLRYAESYFLAREITAFITTAAESLPNTRLQIESLPCTNGWLWLDRGIPCQLGQWSREHGCQDSSIRAISWIVSHRETDGRTYATPNGPPDSGAVPHGLSLFGYFDCEHEGRQELVYMDSWPFSEGSRDGVQETVSEIHDPSVNALVRSVAAAFFLFILDRILIASRQYAERHARKRLEAQGWTTEPLIRVVELRRRQSQPNHTDEHKAIAWSHQWVVSGHWRQQPYPSLGIVQPRWITPYVKGPEDRPLKPPRAKVFAVVR